MAYKEIVSPEVIKFAIAGEHIEGIFKGIEPSKQFQGSYALTIDVDGILKVIFVNNIVYDKIKLSGVLPESEIKIEFSVIKK